MLSTNSTSSIQKRRQFHRRQQSLEVPILATPLPANPRRTKPAPHAHRRGLSLDQSLSALQSPTGFRPLLPQDQDQEPFQGTPPVRIQLDTTNLADQQHFVQESQQHTLPAQPGYQAQDFSSHLQQQLNGNVNTHSHTHSHIVSPTPTHPKHQEQALQELQHHLEWYQSNFGHSPSPNPIMQATTTFVPAQEVMIGGIPFNPVDAQAASQYIVGAPQTPVSHGHSHTVPNTPQQYVHNWPSPPATEPKHVRSQSFHIDVAPMPGFFDNAHPMRANSPYAHPQDSFSQDALTGEIVYASSAYSSSNVDPMSPRPQYGGGPMPTLFEEPLDGHAHSHGLPDDALLLQAAAGASDDFNSPNFIIGGMSPRSAMMASLGDEVNATIIDTGIDPEEVERNISLPHPDTKWWYCLYEEDGKQCGKSFKRKENARSHVQNHLGDRQFQCNDCSKTFVRQHDMKRHAAIHKDERAHTCPCGSKFARHDALTRHRQRGMCSGALPGYEKSEEEKPKRGRPKKERPDQKTRIDKAKKARQMDRENQDEAAIIDINYGSPSSGMSEHSLPMTPPDTSDFDADAYINMVNADIDYNTATSSWRDTPPTSPISSNANAVKTISPAMLNYQSFTGGSSPEVGHESFDGRLQQPTPENPYPQGPAFLDRTKTPEYGSTIASSPYTADYGAEMRQTSWGSLFPDREEPFFFQKEPEQVMTLGPMLTQWLADN